jgi:tetratricopeptide (TPR) repeat protein
MADTTLPDSYVQKFLNNFAIAKINAEIDTITAARYGVRSYPTILVLKPNGVEIDRLVGYYPPVEFVGGIVNALSGIGTLEDLQNKLAARPKDVDLTYEVGQKYRWRGDYDKAAAYFQQVMALDTNNAKKLAAQAAYNLGHMQYKEKNYSAAIGLWQKMIGTYPQDSAIIDAQLMVALSYQKANDFKNAKAEFKHFLQKYPDTDEKEWINEQLAAMEKK